jgi:hypothetical protein
MVASEEDKDILVEAEYRLDVCHSTRWKYV